MLYKSTVTNSKVAKIALPWESSKPVEKNQGESLWFQELLGRRAEYSCSDGGQVQACWRHQWYKLAVQLYSPGRELNLGWEVRHGQTCRNQFDKLISKKKQSGSKEAPDFDLRSRELLSSISFVKPFSRTLRTALNQKRSMRFLKKSLDLNFLLFQENKTCLLSCYSQDKAI